MDVWGNEFGFSKKRDGCDHDDFLLTLLSTYEETQSFAGTLVLIDIEVGGLSFKFDAELVGSGYEREDFVVVSISNTYAEEDFITLLKKESTLKIKIPEKVEWVKYLDASENTFSLNGFTANRLKAKEYCEALSK